MAFVFNILSRLFEITEYTFYTLSSSSGLFSDKTIKNLSIFLLYILYSMSKRISHQTIIDLFLMSFEIVQK